MRKSAIIYTTLIDIYATMLEGNLCPAHFPAAIITAAVYAQRYLFPRSAPPRRHAIRACRADDARRIPLHIGRDEYWRSALLLSMLSLTGIPPPRFPLRQCVWGKRAP